MVYLSLSALIVRKYLKHPDTKYFVYALLLPSITAYLHLYDLILLVAMVVINLISSPSKRFYFIFALLLFPADYSSTTQIFLVFTFISLVVATAHKIGFLRKVIPDFKSGAEVLVGFLTTVLISYFPISIESKVAWQLTIGFFLLLLGARRRAPFESIIRHNG